MIRYYGRRQKPRRRIKTAVALEYQRGRDPAPTVTASGRGELAEQIISLARAHGVYIQEDPQLADILADLDLGEAIPRQLYQVVAEVLAFVYQLNAEQRAAAPQEQPQA